MLFSTIFSSALLASGVMAAYPKTGPGTPGWAEWYKSCLNPDQVKSLIDGYTYLLVYPGGPNFNSIANSILTPDFQVFSDSILTLSGRPLDGSPAFPSRAGFIASQYQTPPLPVLNTPDYFYSCENQKIGWRWKASGIGSNQYPISGLIDMDLSGGLIKTVYSEFNTASFLVDLGVSSCKPPSRG